MPSITRAQREPLVLLHPLAMSARVWDAVTPWLEAHHDLVALTALDHRGGEAATQRPVTVRELVDHTERALDAHGLDRPHIAGNSLGGWIAIELARRGRARTVCALSPAGTWTAGTAEQTDSVRKLRRTIRTARLGRALPMSLLLRSATVRRMVLRDAANHGEHLTATQALEATRDLLACTVADDILTTSEELAPLDPPPCPITIAWSGDDALLPVDVNGAIARQRLPHARFAVLAGLGHVPIDDPQKVARTILQATKPVGNYTLAHRRRGISVSFPSTTVARACPRLCP
jgi:pimeloyl-ACP methyl ester carboxylesterase